MAGVRINKSNATIDVGSNAYYIVNGNDDTVSISENSAVFAWGSGFVIDVLGDNDTVIVTGNGAGATESNTDVLTLHAPATLRELANASVDVKGDDTRMSLAGDDTLSVRGAGDTVNAAGLGDGVSIGGNGAGASGADLDTVVGLHNGSLLVFEGSTVLAVGVGFTATLSGDDTLTARGSALQIYATGAHNTILTGGNNQTPGDDDVVHMNDGVVNIIAHSSAEIFGDNLSVNGYGNDAVTLTGVNDRLVLGSYGNNVTFGQNGDPNGGLDTLQFSYTPFVEPVTVLQRSNVRISGSNANVMLGGDDQVTLIGIHEQIVDQTGNNHISIGGNGSVFFGEVDSYVALAPGDTVTMLANSNLTLFGGAAANGQYDVHMSSKDALSIDSGMTVYVPVAVGDDLLLNFGSGDVLQLASYYKNVNDLLAHASEDGMGRTILQLDAGTDTLTLGMDKATFTTYAQDGLIKFR